MQSASSNFTQEASGGQVTWAKPRVFADWDRTGYGAAGTIDDLSDQVGDSFVIVHSLDDGLPDDVSLSTTQDGVTLELDLAYGRGNRASQYFSPYNTTSPVSGFDRDVAPVKLDWGLVTSAGQEYVRLFTGQMTNLRTAGQGAHLSAVSATRLKLMKLIQPPAVDAQGTGAFSPVVQGAGPGMNATWPISYALAQCGVYVSPPPRTGCRLWMPMHGSLQPFIPDTNSASPYYAVPSSIVKAAGGPDVPATPNWQAGPFLMATADYVTAAQSQRSLIYRVELDTGTDILSQAGNAGRVEFWIKGDAAETVSPPGGAGNVPWLAGFDFKTTTAVDVQAGVGTDRKVYVTVNDGAGHTITLKSPTTLAADGAWYFVGAAWDVAGKKLWVNHNGTTTATGAPTLVTSSLPLADTWSSGANQPSWSAHLPVAEVQVTAGTQANPDTTVWINDATYWTAVQSGAIIRPSILNLRVLAEPVPREAWEFIGSFAQAELAQMRTDENDLFCYLPMPHWAEAAQQTVVDTISSSRNAQDIDIDLDPTKVRNSVRIAWSDIHIDSLLNPLYAANSASAVPPGESFQTFTFDTPAVDIMRGVGFAVYGDDILGQNINFPPDNYVSLSPNVGGGGTYATDTQVSLDIYSWHAGGCVVRFYNNTSTTYYLANQSHRASIQIAGQPVQRADAAVVGQDTSSIARRGERALTLDMPVISNRSDAQAIADELASRLARPMATASGVMVFADPRRQPGDLVALDDSVNTGLSGLWRIQSITHRRRGAEYTQECVLRKAPAVMTWDVNNWDETIWGS